MTEHQTDLSYRKIFIFWIPLAATWLMMSVEGPFLAALIARSPMPKFNLAAYGVAYSFALIIEAPVIMMMSASTALVKDFNSFIKLRNFTFALSAIITIIMLILIIPDIFYFITTDLINLPDEVSRLTHIATVILIPWPGAIGYRRFYQGVLIRNELTRRVAYGTIIRLAAMAMTATVLFIFVKAEGVIIGAASLTAGVTSEAIASRFMVNDVLRKLKLKISDKIISFKEIFNFYYPLALTSLIGLGIQPLVTFLVGQSQMAIESLAVLPVVTSFVFIFRAMGLSYQEVVIALLSQNKKNYKKIVNFAVILAISLVAVLAIISFSSLSLIWFKDISGLSEFLSEFARIPLMIMAMFPALTVLINVQRGILVSQNFTKPITLATVIEFIFVIVSMLVAIKYFSAVGAIAATMAFVIGRIMANAFLGYSIKKND
jgi:O-antigen/teichoic acid export membrane protein